MIEKEALYPILFTPALKPVMWGGNKLKTVLGRTIPPGLKDPVGESWEISDRPDVNTVAAEGPLAGTSLHEMVEYYGSNLVGSKYRGGPFPLLVKLIDAGRRLSLQVHPDEAACERIGNGAQPKTEMWYIIAADPGSQIIAGLRPDTTRVKFFQSLTTAECEHSLQVFDSVPGDAYFINAGRVHAIGSGNLLLEIQQNSDTTYRISDWGRVGSDGKPRQLHIKEAKECIDYNDRTLARIAGVSNLAGHNRRYPVINKCPFFRVEDMRLTGILRDTTVPGESFHILTSVNSTVTVGRPGAEAVLPPGTTCLVPACFGSYCITVPEDKTSTVIKTTL